jgi:hypothetical protein
MDKEILVKAGHLIVSEMTSAGHTPKAAVWVHATDTDTWKFWIVSPKSLTDKREFYRILSSIVSKHRAELGGVDAADAELISDSHPAIRGMRGTFKVAGGSAIFVKDCVLNGFFVAEAIILEMNL